MLYFWIIIAFVFFAIGTPIGFALAASSSVAALWWLGISPPALASKTFESINSFIYLAIPLFILAGNLMVHGGAAKPLVGFVGSLVRQFRGGLGLVVILVCGLFATCTGSALATAAAIGTIMFPLMRESGYSDKLSTGTIAIGSTLGPIIPPSIWMILYGPMAEVSVAEMFVAGAIPGVILIIAFLPVVRALAQRGNVPVVPAASWGERRKSFVKALGILFMPVIILGGIYSGVFTPTEAAVIAVLYTAVIGVVVYRQLRFDGFLAACRETLSSTAMVFIIVTGAILFGFVVAQAGIPKALASAIIGLGITPFSFLCLVTVLYIFLGMFMGSLAILIVFTPFFLPVVPLLGIDPIHFGMVVIMTLCLGEVSPPFGAAVFTLSSVTKVPSAEIFSGARLLMLTMVVMIFVIIAVPSLSLFLPQVLGFR